MYQRTLAKPIKISGVGLHTGLPVNMILEPAEPGHGIKFQRIDMEGEPVINADVDLVVSVERGTTLQKGEVKIATVEHALAALMGLEVDNVLIKLDQTELPIMDGSAKYFVEAIKEGGIVEQNEERDVFELTSNVRYKDPDNGTEILALPSDRYKITALIDYKSPVLGQQHASLDRLEDFEKEFADARTFCFLHELELLIDADLIKGGDLNNAIVVVDKVLENGEVERLCKLFNRDDVKVDRQGILNNVELRYGNEPARHKVLDILGDLALIGTNFKANILATKPGHQANIEFAKIMKRHIKKVRQHPAVPEYDPNKEPVLDTKQIEKCLPHRYPFLLVDKIIHLEENQVVGVKNITFNEPFFVGHFPGNPVMPGVLQIEAMAQTGGILAMNTVDDPENYNTYFLKIDKAKFKKMVVPGDTLIFKLELLSPIRRGIVEMKGVAFVGNKVVCEAELIARLYRKEGV